MSSRETSAPWSRLLEQRSLEELARLLVESLEWQSTEELLCLDGAELEPLLEHFAEAALDEVIRLGRLQELEQTVTSTELTLAENGFEATEQYGPAAALCALAHDALSSRGDDSRVRFEQLLLRHKLAHVLWLADKRNPENIRRCAAFTERTVSLLARLQHKLPPEASHFLGHNLGSWLGGRWSSLAEHRQAEVAYTRASRTAMNADDRVTATVLAAQARAKGGDLQGAYELLCSAREELDQCTEKQTREVWDAEFNLMHLFLGGDLEAGGPSSIPAMEALRQFLVRILEEDYKRLDFARLAPFISMARQEIFETAPEDVDYLHQTLTQLASILSMGDPEDLTEAEGLLEEAEQLEDRVTDKAQVLERILARADLADRVGELDRAERLLSRDLDSARSSMDVDRRLAFVGKYLEVLFRRDAVEPDKIYRLVDWVLRDFDQALAQQPGAPARRRVVELNQRVLEIAVMNLLRVAEEDEVAAQTALRAAWDVLAKRRNVELQQPEPEEIPAEIAARIRQLEDAFHDRLRRDLVTGCSQGADWQEAIEALYELELTSLSDARRQQDQGSEIPGDIAALAFFKVRDLLEFEPLVIMSCFEGEFDARWLGAEDALEDRLNAWARPLFEHTAYSPRSVRVHRTEADSPGLAGAPGFDELLSPRFLQKPFPRLKEILPRPSRGARDQVGIQKLRYPRPSLPWLILPDGALNAIPLEMLPDHAGSELRFGQDRSVVYGLRNKPSDRARLPIDLDRGWLGLGGIPPTGTIGELPGSETEVWRIQRFLEKQGHPTSCLVGAEATATRLSHELERVRPAVLHFAVHGFAESRYPEACTLVLADQPGRAERELLPFRRISALPLDSVELVVLSACSSLIGRSGRAAAMEGLAWAFLSSGVAQVIASRFPVEDRATSRFMPIFYEQLLASLPVGLALGRTRQICLHQEHFAPGEVAAWSCWC